MRRYTFAVAAVLVVLSPWRQETLADAPRYSIENLGTLQGSVPTVTGVNASGQVSGYVNVAEGQRAVRYTKGQGWQYLPGLDTTFSIANGINAAGDLVGYYQTPEGAIRAFRYHGGTIDSVPPIGGGFSTVGFGINSAGDIVGYADTADGSVVGFVAHPDQSVTVLPSLGGPVTLACGINDNGQVAGWSMTGNGAQHAIRIDKDQPSPIDIGNFTADGASTACAIDAAGRVGGVIRKNDLVHAFRFQDGAFENLGAMGSADSNVESIANGVSVGWYLESAANQQRAFVHSDKGGFVDLNTLTENAAGWTLATAKGINADGVIVGEGMFNGLPAVFRLVPQASDTTPPVFVSLTVTPSEKLVPKGQLVSVTAHVNATDDSGEQPACALTGVAGPGVEGLDYGLTGPQTAVVRAVGGRSYTLTETCVDAAGNAAAEAVVIDVPRDTTAPAITSISATPSHIWPPNNKMVPVSVFVAAKDDVDDATSCSITSISGAPSSDYEITGRFTANVRASKNDDGSSRVYSLKVTCKDAAGNRSTAVAHVSICKEGASAPAALVADAPKSNKK